jgi:hypothetical protein
MHTLALPPLPVKPARDIAGGRCRVGATLPSLSRHACTSAGLAGPVSIQHQSTGTPLGWPTPPLALRLELGAAVPTLLEPRP